MRKGIGMRGWVAVWILFGSVFLWNLMAVAEDTEQKNGDVSERMASIIKRHKDIIQAWAKDLVLVKAVKSANRKGTSLAEIRRIDAEWVGGKADKLVMELQNNPAGRYLTQKVKSNGMLYVEAFLCDNKGAVVGEYPKTTDYWQGDEDKFVRCFNNGNGQAYIGSPEFDESSKTFSVQVSVPVLEEGQTIGVLVVGLKNIK